MKEKPRNNELTNLKVKLAIFVQLVLHPIFGFGATFLQLQSLQTEVFTG